MDDRESVYYDTISVAGSEPNRKSLSLSRQTIYHSADDLPGYDPTPSRFATNNRNYSSILTPTKNSRNPKSNDINSTPYYSHIALAGGDYGDGGGVGGGGGRAMSECDEVSASLLDSYNRVNKKLPITYSQWKSRTWRRFEDGERSVDFILAFRGNDINRDNIRTRQIFERNLEKEGLQLEREKTQKIHFIKIHAPFDVLCRYCEVLKMKMPIKKLREQDSICQPELRIMKEMKSFFGRPFKFVKLDRNIFPERDYSLMLEYSRNYNFLFDAENPNFFNAATRSNIINFILERQRFSEDADNHTDIGINKLIEDQVYEAAYPLHDGDGIAPGSERYILLKEWASIRKWIKHQPLDNIKEYFGVKIALYFAWLGFYTHMLIPASIAGLICFFYGLVNLGSDKMSDEICSKNNTILMCPQCNAKCDYWYLNETCIYSRISSLFDNNLTIYFAVFMSFWATLYLELWKRYSVNLIHRWGLTDYCHRAEHPRPQYLAQFRTQKKTKFNEIHRILEPNVPFWKVKFPRYLISYSIVFLFICLAIAAVFGVVVYRMSTNTSQNIYGNTDSMSYKIMVLPATAAVINLVVITILNYIYDYLAVFLTDIEYRRTQTEYDESLTLKIYLFQFVNYYSSIFYIAYFKGKFVGYPAKYNKIFSFRQEECSPGGCLMELCIQLVIIMVGKQAINAVIEMVIPYLKKTFNSVTSKIGLSSERGENFKLISCNQWTQDYNLVQCDSRVLFEEYLEMVIQYGFITLFVVAFPLAPLFALFNNVLEMRLDAKKFLMFYRRPVAQRVKDIGVWYYIMSIIGKISVASSAFIIAFSSNFIPRLVYAAVNYKQKRPMEFLNFTLAYFDTKDFQEGTEPMISAFANITSCRYQEYRNPPWSDQPYKKTQIYWHILAARLAFIVVFQNIVGMVQMIVAWAIPDTPRKLRDRIKREEFLTREIIIENETHRNSNGHLKVSVDDVENGNVFTEIDLGGGDDSDDKYAFRRRRNNPDVTGDRTTPV
ncbi:anoctamin-4 isoform X2 [Hermetia illucens]|nr:anoctamin-4 isoform X2 [Hermetia illucens]XP_037919310.1 anoctamin-4 isoform X2 [Hermetia illucens]